MKKKKQKEEINLDKEVAIMAASIVDLKCNFSFEILQGPGVGHKHSVKGEGEAERDLIRAFENLNKHFAAIDDAFAGRGVDDINKMSNDVSVAAYEVTGIKIKGTHTSDSVVITGIKQVSCSEAHSTITTPKIPLDDMSSYRWYQELREAVDLVREEVELYKNGKCIPIDTKTDIDDNQLTITEGMEDFEEAKL